MTTQVLDTYFADWRDALRAARQGNRVQLTIAATGSQICYYDGPPVPGDLPPTMVHLPFPEIARFFLRSNLRMPGQIHFPKGFGDRAAMEGMGRRLIAAIQEAKRLRAQDAAAAIARIRSRPPPEHDFDGPLRVLIPASRYTTVMQYCSRGLTRAFERLGHEVRFLIEEDDCRLLGDLHMIREIEAYEPQIVVLLNHLYNRFIHPGTVAVSWWQDPMPEITGGARLPWRERDLVYVLARHPLEEWLVRTGLSRDRIRVQPFCIDPEIFHDRGGPPRQDKVVFIGSSARRVILGIAGEKPLIEALTARILAGEHLRQGDVFALADRFGVPRDHAYLGIHHYLVRDLPVRWLCRQKEIPVEVYGRFWDEDPEVAPRFKGEVPHGPAVAEIYRSARYALSPHSQLIGNQRLAEAAACGCIPVAFDCRYHAEPPFWEEQCLFFRTPEELGERFRRRPPTSPEIFRDHYSYDRFARRILADARAAVEGPGPSAERALVTVGAAP